MKILILILALVFQGCATIPGPRYVWLPREGATQAQVFSDKLECKKIGALAGPGFADYKYQTCMIGQGHTLAIEKAGL